MRTRQFCTAGKADFDVVATALPARNPEFAAGLEGANGMRVVQDDVLSKPPGGRARLAHQDCADVASSTR